MVSLRRPRFLQRRSARGAMAVEPPCEPCEEAARSRPFTINPRRVPLGPDAVPQRCDGCVEAVLATDVVVVERRTLRPSVLNARAGLLWLSVDGVSTVEEIVAALALETGASADEIRADVTAGLQTLVDTGLLTVTAPAAALHTTPGPQERPRWDAVRQATLARSSWPYCIGPLRVGGSSITIVTNHAELATDLRSALADLPPGRAGDHSEVVVVDRARPFSRRFGVFVDGCSVWVQPTVDGLAHAVVRSLNPVAIDRNAGFLRLHAGAVEQGGRVVVITGASGAGKSSLVAHLVHAGLGYVTDEVACIDPGDLRVQPFPKPIELDGETLRRLDVEAPAGWTGSSHGKGYVPASSLGPVSTGGHLVGVIRLVASPTPQRADSRELSSEVSTLLSLVEATFGASLDTPQALQGLADLLHEVPVVELERAPLDELGAAVVGLLDGGPPPPVGATPPTSAP